MCKAQQIDGGLLGVRSKELVQRRQRSGCRTSKRMRLEVDESLKCHRDSRLRHSRRHGSRKSINQFSLINKIDKYTIGLLNFYVINILLILKDKTKTIL